MRYVGPGFMNDDHLENGLVSQLKELQEFRSFLARQAKGVTQRFDGKLDSSDIVQETLVEAFQQLDNFRGKTNGELAKWLSQMLAHNITDAGRALRRKKRDINREQSIDDNGSRTAPNAANWMTSDQTSPSICVEKAEQLLKITSAVNELPENQQQVVVLYHLQGYSMAEVADQIGKSHSAVAGLLHRGLKALRKKLGQ